MGLAVRGQFKAASYQAGLSPAALCLRAHSLSAGQAAPPALPVAAAQCHGTVRFVVGFMYTTRPLQAEVMKGPVVQPWPTLFLYSRIWLSIHAADARAPPASTSAAPLAWTCSNQGSCDSKSRPLIGVVDLVGGGSPIVLAVVRCAASAARSLPSLSAAVLLPCMCCFQLSVSSVWYGDTCSVSCPRSKPSLTHSQHKEDGTPSDRQAQPTFVAILNLLFNRLNPREVP